MGLGRIFRPSFGHRGNRRVERSISDVFARTFLGHKRGVSRFLLFRTEAGTLVDWHFSALVGLASAQVLIYQINSKQALRAYLFFGFLYFFLFSFAWGLGIFCDLFSITFYKIPLLSLVLFLVFGRKASGFPRFQKAFQEAPDFYLLSSLWISLIWVAFFQGSSLLSGFFWSFFAALLLSVLAGIKERLALINPPNAFQGFPLFLAAAGFLLLGLHFFINFKN